VRDALVLVVGVMVLAMLDKRKRVIEWGSGWFYPMPDLRPPDGVKYPATISQEFRSVGREHYGVDVMYRRRSPVPSGRSRYWCPDGVPAYAARAGTIWSVDRAPRGWTVVIDHGPPWATFYTHLASIVNGLTKGVIVSAGDKIGTVGYDPLDPNKVVHLHFAVWHAGSGDRASVDPTAVMGSWQRREVPWTTSENV